MTAAQPDRTRTKQHSARPDFIRVSSLSKKFGDDLALDDVSLAAREGSTLALLGPSGCGKTTMLRCIAGLETPDRGSIEIGDLVMFDAARRINLVPERRKLGIVFQSYAIWPHMTVAANIGFPLKVRGVGPNEIAERVNWILAMVGLAGWRDRPATDLSGGQQQRVALARALIHEPQVVLFDEPMSNLDAQLRDHMRLELKTLQQQLGFTAVYVTHDQSEAFGLAQMVIVMNRGRVEAAGTPYEIVRRPKSEFVARFLGYNVLTGRVLSDPVRVAAGANGTSENWVQIALGDRLKAWGIAGPGAGLRAGSTAVLCVRRERIHLSPADAAGEQEAGPGESQRQTGAIRASSFQGLNQEYIVAIDGVELRVIQNRLEWNLAAGWR
jgi:iron(III) transport system ATP-binding protein